MIDKGAMKERTMNKRTLPLLPKLLISFCVFIGMSVSIAAQSICVPEGLTVTDVSGKVISQLNRGETPLTQVSVALFRDQYQGHLVARTTGDENGRFSFQHIKHGKYILKVIVPNLPEFYVPIRVKPSKAAVSQQEIVVTIGANLIEPCSGSHAKLRMKRS
jgi:hypothetical protein